MTQWLPSTISWHFIFIYIRNIFCKKTIEGIKRRIRQAGTLGQHLSLNRFQNKMYCCEILWQYYNYWQSLVSLYESTRWFWEMTPLCFVFTSRVCWGRYSWGPSCISRSCVESTARHISSTPDQSSPAPVMLPTLMRICKTWQNQILGNKYTYIFKLCVQKDCSKYTIGLYLLDIRSNKCIDIWGFCIVILKS